MRNLIKFFCSAIAFLCAVIFSLVYIGCKFIPDSVITVEEKRYEAPKILGLNLFNSEETVTKVGSVLGTAQAQQNETQIKLLNIIPVKNTKITNSKRQYVIPGGEVFGIKLYTDGVIIVGADTINGINGDENPAETAGLKVGDIIISVNGKKITEIKQLSAAVRESGGNPMKITVLRGNKNINVTFKCVKEKSDGKYKAGLWVRDSTAGIGTVTFYNSENLSFGGLGHAICDVDTERVMPLGKGEMVEAYVKGFYKSNKGNIGELCGVLTGKVLGNLCINNNTGLYGYMNSDIEKKDLLPVAVRQEVHEGKVKIICTIDTYGPRYYDAEIVKVYSNASSVNRDMIIEITDSELLAKTGGILQGMSGTPIIQDGMLVGAITHVLVNNPRQGYAIFSERMLETSKCREMQKYVAEKQKAS